MILEQIVAHKRLELEAQKRRVPLSEVQAVASARPTPLSFGSALRGDSIRLVAEVKRASPSRGPIRPDLEPVDLAQTYARHGAAAISVLTESRYFLGGLEDLRDVQQALATPGLPVLRKDFIFDSYQVFESRAWGADALLLIVAILSPDTLGQLIELSHGLGMGCLVEVHREEELGVALRSPAQIIGINNRNLSTLSTDLNTTRRLRPLIPPDRVVVSESGIRGRTDVERLVESRVDAMLVGESLVSAPDIAAKMEELLG